MVAERATANIDAILLGVARGAAPQSLVEQYGKSDWNAALLLAGAERGLLPDSRLAEALAWQDTTDAVLARTLILRGCQAISEGEDPHRNAILWLESIKRRQRKFDSPTVEAAWLEVGVDASRRAREDIPGLDPSWAQVDMADHLLAHLEPMVGPAPNLRAWACSAACSLPNTLRAFRRGQLRWEAAKVREGREVIENTTKNL